MKTPFKESVKEGLRLVVMAAALALINYLVDVVLPMYEATYTWVPIAILVLRMIDKWIHENKKMKWNGLVPF